MVKGSSLVLNVVSDDSIITRVSRVEDVNSNGDGIVDIVDLVKLAGALAG